MTGTVAPSLSRLISDSGLDATGRHGEPASSVEYRVQAERTVGLLARTLARLHSTPVPAPLAAAALEPAAIVAGLRRHPGLTHTGAAPAPRAVHYAHVGDDRLLAVLADGASEAARRGATPVLTHGAPTLRRCVGDRGAVVGLLDWRRAAIADPYRDLAVAAASIATQFAPILVPVLFERYGETHPDPVRLDWYALAAELSGAVLDPADPPAPAGP